MLPEDFSPLWFPPLTFYRDDGSFDPGRTERMLERVHPYCRGVLVPGSTGDGWLLTQDEQDEVVRFFLKGFPFGRFSMLIGALMPSADETVAAIGHWLELLEECSGISGGREAMAALGVKAFAVCLPRNENDPEKQFAALSKVLDLGLPTAFYQLPQVTGSLAKPETVLRLADAYPNLIICKDSGGGDEVAASGLLSDRLTIVRGAEGYPFGMLFGEGKIYDGLLLSTVNSFPSQLARLIGGEDCYAEIGDVIEHALNLAAVNPVSNMYSDANRAMDHVLYYGRKAPYAPLPAGYGGKKISAELVAAVYADMDRAGLVPEKGYSEA